MKYNLSIKEINYNSSLEINDNIQECHKNIIFDYISNISEINEFFENSIYEAIYDYSLPPQKYYDIYKIEDDIYDYLLSKPCKVILNAESESSLYKFDLIDLYMKAVESWHLETNTYADIAGVVEKGLLRFVKESKWHYGFFYEGKIYQEEEMTSLFKKMNTFNLKECDPILWYGIENESVNKGWIIKYSDFEKDIEFFSYSDNCDPMEKLTNSDEGFLIWYSYECGCVPPDLTELLNKCPVKIDFNNILESKENMKNFFADVFSKFKN